jgi:transposase
MASKRYSKEFKDGACRLVMEQQYPISRAAKELGVGDMTLRKWLDRRGWRLGDPAAAQSADPKVLQVRIRELEQQLRRAEMEKEILKKATAFFASQNR